MLSFTANLIKRADSEQPYNFNEDVCVNYGILVNNTGELESQNISKVEVVLPASFLFCENTNWTDASNSVFVNQSNNLSWSADNLIPNLSSRSFFF